MKGRHCSWIAFLTLSLGVQGVLEAAEAAAPAVSQLAVQLYPGHTLLQLGLTSTSRIAAAIAKEQQRPDKPLTSFLIVLGSGKKSLVVDETLTIGPGESWVIATPAGLQAAADGAALDPADLLAINCAALANGSFITNSNPFLALELLGLSISGCPSTAIDLYIGKKLLLSNVQLKNSNAKKLAEDGGALLLSEIEQVMLVNSACIGNYVLLSGGCVHAEKFGKFTAMNSTFTNNVKSDTESGGRLHGGGVLFFESAGDVTITNCDFAHNTALYGNGGSLFCSMCRDISIASSSFVNNSAAELGGCIYAGEVASLNVDECNFTGNGQLPGAPNTQTQKGAAIAMHGTHTSNLYPVNLVVRRSSFVQNTAELGGAIFALQYSIARGRVEVQGCQFSENTGIVEAGAIMIDENMYTELIVNASKFEANTGGIGGAISAYDADVSLIDCSFTGNEAEIDGGALQIFTMQAAGSGNLLAVTRSTFTNNTADKFGGAVAVYMQGLVMEDTKFVDNMGGSGGGIYLENGPTAQLRRTVFEGNGANRGSGGAVRMATVGQLVMQGVQMKANEAPAGSGGAMQVAQVSGGTLSGLTVTDGFAGTAGGGLSFLSSNNVTLEDSLLFNNTALLGAGLAADSTEITVQGVNITGNLAVQEESEGSARRRKLQSATADAAPMLLYGSEVYAATTGGAILVQQSRLSLIDSILTGNTAGGDAGALFVQSPTGLNMTNNTFSDNVAETGMGAGVVVRAASAAVAASAKDCTFKGNAAKQGNGGAVFIDSGLGSLEVVCDGCAFEGNKAGKSGGAVAAAGPTSFMCVNCQSQANEAGHHGGWLHCSGCNSTSITAGKSTSNKAGAAGGSVSCMDCGTFISQQYEYSNNLASSGGAIAVQMASEMAVSNCNIDSNSAGNTTQDAVTSPLVRRVYALPPAWQAMYGIGAATVGLGCGGQGAGGGLCMSGAGAANITDNSITGNRGSTGGAIFASAHCDASVGGCRLGQVNVTGLAARNNSATEAGGVLYTTTPSAVSIGIAGEDPSSASARQRREEIVQQLSEDNSVGEAGYGPAVASFPTELSLMYPVQDDGGVAAFEVQAAEQAPSQQRQQQQQAGTGRKLQQVPLPSTDGVATAVMSATRDFQRQVDSTYRISSSPEGSTGQSLQPFCPALGAYIMGAHIMSIGSNQNFSIPVNVLDAFGSKVRNGPGSNWIVALSDNSSNTKLSGSLRGSLSGGYVVLQGLSIQAEPGSRLGLTLRAMPPPGSGDEPLLTNIDVLVRRCVAGEYAHYAGDGGKAGQHSSPTSVTCRPCAAPLYSFSAYPAEGLPGAANETAVCWSCPDRGTCVAGMLIPQSGAFQVHPRSTVIRQCSNARACERNSTAELNLQGLQCSNRRYIDPADIDPRLYTAMQCSRGYAGPFCSSCYRPGRNAWLLQQLDRSTQHEPGFVLGDESMIASGHADIITMGYREVYGKSNGRCERCPHMVTSWIGFFLSRALDLLVIGLMAMLWVFYGWLSQSAAAMAFVQLSHQHMVEFKLRDSIFGTMSSGSKSDLGLTQSLSQLLSGSMATVRSRALSKVASREALQRHDSGPSAAEPNPPMVQSSASQPVGAAARAAAGRLAPPPAQAAAAAGAAPPAYGSPFDLVEQPSVQHLLSSEPSASGSAGQGLTGRKHSGGLYHIYRASSMRWHSAVNMVNQLKEQFAQRASHGADLSASVLVQQAALMLMAVKHLACVAQVVLDGAQIAAVLLSLDLMFLVPDWAAKGLSGVLLTQAHTWQYVPFECLIPGHSEASAAVVQTVLVMLLPIIYTMVLSPALLWLLDRSKNGALYRQSVLEGAAKPANAPMELHNQANTSAPSSWWHRFWPTKPGTWTLLVAVAVASMAYCYSFIVANITAAFNCMSLSTEQSVPGEYQVKRSVWVPDMQLSCSSPPQVAAMVAAIVIGIPLLIGYWMLLLTLAWPQCPVSKAPVPPSKAQSSAVRALLNVWRLIKQACLVPFTWLERPVRNCQQYLSEVGVRGESCTALGVWNVEWRWWWLLGREVVKFALVAAATVTTMRGPEEQAHVLMLLVVVAAAITWRVQAGCSTSMNQLQFVVFCWLQLVALLVMIPSLQEINAAGFGGAVLALVALVVLQCAFVIGCLAWRILVMFRNLSLLMELEMEAGFQPLANVDESR